MADIRSFFGPKGGAAPAKPAPKKEDDAAKKRGRARKVVDESEDEVVEVAKTKPAPKKKKGEPEPVKGVETTASDYFASSKAAKAAPKAAPKPLTKTEIEIRESPRKKEAPATKPVPAAAAPAPKKRGTGAYKSYAMDDDADAFVDGDDDDGDDIFAADAKRGKRKNDDYVEDESDEDDFEPKPKRVAARSAKAAPITLDADADEKPAAKKGKAAAATAAAAAAKPAPKTVSSRKRKSPDLELSDSDDASIVAKPRKKAATAASTAAAKPKAAPAKTTTPRKPAAAKPAAASSAGGSSSVQAILDSIPLITPPSPPPKSDSAPKFDWRKKGGGGGAAPPMAGTIDVPEGGYNCLVGQSFVFTGTLRTIGRDECKAIVNRYGGKVMGAPSKNTGWIVLGDDAGPSKLQKIQQLGLRTIDENGLFEMIRRLPAGGGDSKEAEKAREKQEKEAEKVRLAADAMEREEESKRLQEERAAKAAARAAEKAAEKAAAASGSAYRPPPVAAPRAPPPSSTQLWTTKYAPTTLTQICGNKAQVERIASWLKNWSNNKKLNFESKGGDGLGTSRAIIISGPPGIGKTTAAHLAAKIADHDVIESNASDTRSKRLVEDGIGDTMNNTSLLGFFAADGKAVNTERKNIVLIMDEVDGMSAGDRGGIVALAKFCRKTEVPLILICNERRLPKMRPFDHVAFDIRFNRPTVDQIRARILTICHREGLKMPPQVVDALIEGTGKDIRQIINMLSTAKLDQSTMTYDEGKAMTKAWEKHVVLKPWDICSKLLGGGMFAPASKATLNDKIELYFNDHEFSYLMIQENYLNTRPMAMHTPPPGLKLEADKLKTKSKNARRLENLRYLELVDRAAESISDGDLVDRMIHGPQQQWSLMPTHAVFSTVRPASLIAGQTTTSNFTSWLGNNSKTGKLGRLLREVHAHMRLRTSGDHNQIRQEYLPVLWFDLIKKLEVDGRDAIDDVIAKMDDYYLTRDDIDAIRELGLGAQAEDRVNIDSKVKAAFTRQYNGMSHPIPFMKASVGAAAVAAAAASKKSRDAPDLEEAIEEEDDAAAEAVPDAAANDDDEEFDPKKDKMIKLAKPKAKPKAAAAKAAPKAAPKKRAPAKKK